MYVVRIFRLMGLSSTRRKLVPGREVSVSEVVEVWLSEGMVVRGVERRTRSGREIS